ncbi:5'-deoxynucleotidase HDDC2-like [Tubulanus polymorphus]|uniref:5'-deoxynucleotidase HDDC2-like n=1 Tax=Tubulanus polymorphus TaxID=672921 RepID=UPI003DA41A9A
MASGGVPKVLDFLSLIGKLKGLKRTGWIRKNVPEPETVASHMYRMAIMTFFLGNDSTLNRDRCMKLALVHDMAESIVGDITPHDGVSKQEKHRREKQAMEDIAKLAGNDLGNEFLSLWQEYEEQTTPEAKVVHDIDRFDMVLQAHNYETAEPDRGRFLQEFFDSTQDRFQHPLVIEWMTELNKQRNRSQQEKINSTSSQT